MKTIYSIVSLILLVACSSPKQAEMKNEPIIKNGPTKEMLASITKKDLIRNLTFIASDELKGRNTASPELKIAAKYIATQLESYGFKGIGPNGSFFQKVPLFHPSFDASSAKLSYNGKDLEVNSGKDFAVYAWGNKDLNFELPLVSIQNAIDNQYNSDFVDGKAAIRFLQSDDQKAITKKTHQQMRDAVFSNGAKIVIVILDDSESSDVIINRYEKIGSQAALTNQKVDNERAYIFIKRNIYQKILKEDKKRSSKKASNYTFKHKLNFTIKANSDEIYSQNIVATLEGSDPLLKNEYVGFGAHYDHDGIKAGKIYNGANDDGSGTVGLVSVAKALGKNPPKRSILLVFHTAEEKGLLGSEYFTDNPLIDLKDLVSMTNMDMIGSNFQPERIYVVGSDRISQELHNINETVNAALDSIVLDYEWNAFMHPERIFYRSDHYNYAKHGVPIIFYSDKDPDNYHKPTDTVDKINFDKLFKATRLAYTTGYVVANQPHRLKISNPVVKPIMSEADAAKFVGVYKTPRFAFEIKHVDNMLYLYTGTRRMLIEPIEGNKYHAKGMPLEFTFENGSEKASSAALTWGTFGTFLGVRK